VNDNGLTCKELVELVTDYFEGTLPLHERLRLEAHLEKCAGCRNYIQQMRQTLDLCGHLAEDAIAPEAKEELLDVFRAWKQAQHQ
jgi:predicted anti-sigma-YlaC factor YlaD